MSKNKFINKLKPYTLSVHEAWELKTNKIFKLDWNESTYSPSPHVISTLKKSIYNKTNWYPDTANKKLINLLSKYSKVSINEVQYFAGSDAAHEYIVRSFLNLNEKVIIVSPTYDNFRVVAKSQGAKIIIYNINLNEKLQTNDLIKCIKKHKTSMLYLVNPNNPTGLVVPKKDIQIIVKSCPKCMFVIDEAYYEFGGINCTKLVKRYKNLIITRTFSKAFGLASLRIGYIISNSKNIDFINKIRNAKSISALAQVAAIAALEDLKYVNKFIDKITESKKYFSIQLNKIGINNYYGGGNYILLNLKNKNEKDKVIKHLRKNYIFVRNLSHIKTLKNFIRITIGTKKIMNIIIKKIKVAIKN